MEAPSQHDAEKSTRLKEETSSTEVEKMWSSTYFCHEMEYSKQVYMQSFSSDETEFQISAVWLQRLWQYYLDCKLLINTSVHYTQTDTNKTFSNFKWSL